MQNLTKFVYGRIKKVGNPKIILARSVAENLYDSEGWAPFRLVSGTLARGGNGLLCMLGVVQIGSIFSTADNPDGLMLDLIYPLEDSVRGMGIIEELVTAATGRSITADQITTHPGSYQHHSPLATMSGIPPTAAPRPVNVDDVNYTLAHIPTFGYTITPYKEGAMLEYIINDRSNISFYWLYELLATVEMSWRCVEVNGRLSDQPENQIATLKAQLLTLAEKLIVTRQPYTSHLKFTLYNYAELGVMLVPDRGGQQLTLTDGVGDQEGCVNIHLAETELGWFYWDKNNELGVEWRVPESVFSDIIKAQLLAIATTAEFYPTQHSK